MTGAVFGAYLYLDSKRRGENIIFVKKVQEIHDSVTKAQVRLIPVSFHSV